MTTATTPPLSKFRTGGNLVFLAGELPLNADGSVRRIQVLRRPGQAADTVQLAMAAVQRAAPFGSVAHLPRPWRYTETFLFDNQRRFKPRTLDL